MNTILPTLLSYLLLYKYFTIFVVVFSAAIIVPFPDSTMLLATGAFASQGYFSLTLSFAVALAANVLGDLVGYALTHIWGYRIIKERHIRKLPYFNNVEKFVGDHVGPTIIVSRFIGTIGPLVNFLSGISNIPLGKFLFFDILGNALDIIALLFIGYELGQYWQDFSGAGTIVGWIFFIGIIMYAIIKISLSSQTATSSKSATSSQTAKKSHS